MRYSASKNDLESGLAVVQGHYKWRRSIDHIRLSVGPSAIVTIAQSCTVRSYLTLNNVVIFKSELEVTQCHSNWYHSKALVRFPIYLP